MSNSKGSKVVDDSDFNTLHFQNVLTAIKRKRQKIRTKLSRKEI